MTRRSPPPFFRHTGSTESLNGTLVEARRDRKVVEPVRRSALQLTKHRIQGGEVSVVVEVSADIAESRCEPAPLRPVVALGGKILDALLHLLAKARVVVGSPCEANDVDVVVESAFALEVEERRDELPPCQISRGTEDDDRCRLLIHDAQSELLMAWPPNWFRIAARSFAA